MRRLALPALLPLLAAAACGDDAPGACLHGMVREPGTACTLPPTLDMIIDGRRDDWTNPRVLEVLVPGSCCAAGESGITNAGRQYSDGRLVFYGNTIGPTFGVARVYGLSFRRADLPENDPASTHTLFLARPSPAGTSVEVYVNDVRVFGAPGEAVVGDAGVEWRLPPEVLPYPGVALVQGVTYQIVDGEPTLPHPARTSARLCWDPDAPDDPCRAE